MKKMTRVTDTQRLNWVLDPAHTIYREHGFWHAINDGGYSDDPSVELRAKKNPRAAIDAAIRAESKGRKK